ncbi:MAG: hypothetical protein SOH81_11080 [Acetobacter sp.]|jgi:hypothetical protein
MGLMEMFLSLPGGAMLLVDWRSEERLIHAESLEFGRRGFSRSSEAGIRAA